MIKVRESSDAWERKHAIEDRIRRFPPATIKCDGPGCTQQAPRHRCSKCWCNYYCSRECQKNDWKHHKKYCVEVDGQRINPVAYPDDINDIPETACTREAVNVECPICLEQPIRNRIVLKQCRHGFCLSCIVNLYTHHRLVVDGTTSEFCCPCCRANIDEVVEDEILEKSEYLFNRATNRTSKDSKETKMHLLRKAVDWLDVVLSVDTPLLVAYLRKAEFLILMGDGQKALEAVALMCQHSKMSYEHPVTTLIREQMALESNDTIRYDILKSKISKAAEEHGLPAVPLPPNYLYSIYMVQAKAYHLLQHWDLAVSFFHKAAGAIPKNPRDTTYNQVMMILSLAECHYDAKDYKNVVKLIDTSLNSFNRRFPGMHKWKAKGLEQMERLDDAIATMSHAVLYETPWDPINQDECLKLYDEMCRRRSKLTTK